MRVLAFSGGKDSWACLHLYAHQLDDITVLWIDTGKNYPETLKQIEDAKLMCPHFYRLPSLQDGQIRMNGFPSDLVPTNNTTIGRLLHGEQTVAVQSQYSCCAANIMQPLNDAIKLLGATEVIRGQRISEVYKSPTRHGETVNGVTYIHPIENWTDEQVLEYLKTRMEVPEHFYLKHSSLDCYDCTGYLSESEDRMTWAAKHHPELHKVNLDNLRKVYSVVKPEYDLMGKLLFIE